MKYLLVIDYNERRGRYYSDVLFTTGVYELGCVTKGNEFKQGVLIMKTNDFRNIQFIETENYY